MNLKHIALAAVFAATASGCTIVGSLFGTQGAEYKGAKSRTVQPLEVPPELTTPTIDDRYAIPDPKAQTTYSAYTARNAPGSAVPAGATATTVLPKVEGARIERAGDQRWLVVQGDPAAVWPLTKEFWTENGYTLARDEPNNGILETDWYEDKSKIPNDIVRRTIGRVMPNIFSTARRDKFRTRLEKGSQAGTTEVFISNRQVEEVWADANQDRTIWQSKPADRELEAEMLQRLLVRYGAVQAQAAAAAAAAKPVVVGDRGAPIAGATTDAKNAVMDSAGRLVVNDSFDRAWRRVGLALDRVGFTVEDRDRSKGLFFVRYIDPERDIAAQKPKENKGLLDRLKFWQSDPSPANQPPFRIHVTDAGASMSQVQVEDAQGAADRSNTAKKIISLLFDQLK